MIQNRRTLTYGAIALIVGAALALAVALASGGTQPSSASSTGAQLQSSSELLAETSATGSMSADPLSGDPAKQEPLLDKFVSKDPFIPLGIVSPVGPVEPVNPDSGTLGAKIKVDGTSYSVVQGDKVPGGTPAFTISSITSGDVTFAVIDGTTKGGDASVKVNLGESVKVTLDGGKSYTLAVTSIGKSGGGGTSGHSISVLSITETNGTALVTIEVDGTTYADKKVGDVFTTSWGEIKVVAINVSAQTVTLMHGDQTITLRAGQVVVK